MAFTRRSLLKTGGSCAAALSIVGATRALSFSAAEAATSGKTPVGDNGLHVQDWFLESFLELGEDYSEAASAGKGLIVLFEQRGCPYCRELHDVNLARKDIRAYMQKHFVTVQLDIYGSREVTDFDGETKEERRLASRWAVNFTPTAVFFKGGPDTLKGKSGRDREAARMPGYFKPFHFLSMLEFVAEDHYKSKGFQKYLQEKFAKLQEKGEKPDVW